jgi:hypothetical protein
VSGKLHMSPFSARPWLSDDFIRPRFVLGEHHRFKSAVQIPARRSLGEPTPLSTTVLIRKRWPSAVTSYSEKAVGLADAKIEEGPGDGRPQTCSETAV